MNPDRTPEPQLRSGERCRLPEGDFGGNDRLPRRNGNSPPEVYIVYIIARSRTKLNVLKSDFRACVLFCIIRYTFCLERCIKSEMYMDISLLPSMWRVFYRYLVDFIFRRGNSRTLRQLNGFTHFWNSGNRKFADSTFPVRKVMILRTTGFLP